MRSDLAKFLLVPVAAVSVAGCGINSVPTAEENAKAKWADVQAAFQERANLIPNLAAVVKGAAAQENKTLTEVIEARAKATSVTLAPGDLNDPAKMAAFQTAQEQSVGQPVAPAGVGRAISAAEKPGRLPEIAGPVGRPGKPHPHHAA
jgi:LemA protein